MHLAEPENMEANATTQDGNAGDQTKNRQAEKISDLIGNYLNDVKATSYPWVDNSDLVEGIDRITNNLSEYIELVDGA